ncbi:MAG: CBS domain-containing protein [Deltaproteobacteria bacterium]|jgi:tRNA nucleotidyltransferase (CCA-adding enzyme)|nr:CBS domain-containing protein [Deltaproteobacteria bacterium]
MAKNGKSGSVKAETLVTSHVNPDYDAVASMVAAAKLYPDAVMLLPGGQGRNFRNFFIQSLLYYLNVVRPKELDLSSVKRLVVVDTRQRDRLGAAAPCLDNPGLEIHLYDHHPDAPGDLKGAVEVVEQLGANAAIMTGLIRERGVEISPQEATMLALGLYEDTGAFTFTSTTPKDLTAAAWLVEKGADLSVVAELTSRELTAEQLALLNELILTSETRETRGRSLVVAMARRESHIEDVAVLAHKMMDILGADLLFVLVEMESLVQVVCRSRLRDVDVGEIALALGGGGHGAAAAAAIRGKSLQEVREDLERILGRTLDRLYSAGHIMVHPPISINQDRPVSEAMDMLVRFSLNVLLATDLSGRTTGILSEHSVSKAIYHGLASYPVKEVMSPEFQTLPPGASFTEVKTVIVDQGQRILPVTDEAGRALGVITRTDLLRLLAGEVSGGAEESGRARSGPYERNLRGLMEDRLPGKLLPLLDDLSKIAKESGAGLYLVGGTVRDLIMLKPVGDLDLCLTGDMPSFLESVRLSLPVAKIKRHPRFQTATVILQDQTRLDFSSARVEYYEYPGALPVVSKASIQLDLQRRDFTINALALSLNEEDQGRLLDFYRGYQDVKEGLIRVLHSLSIIEDPTRAFRAVRFAARLGFKISRMTLGLVENAIRGGFFFNIHPRRLITELRHVCEEPEAGPALEKLSELGLLQAIHPELKLTLRQKELIKHVGQVREWFGLTFGGQRAGAFWLVYFLVICENLAQGDLAKLVESFETYRKQAKDLVAERPRLNWILSSNRRRRSGQELKPSEIDKIFAPLSWPGALYIMAKSRGETLDRAGAAYLAVYRRVKPLLGGEDLLALGLPPGPGIQKVLSALRLARLDGLVSSVEDERVFAAKMGREGFGQPSSSSESGGLEPGGLEFEEAETGGPGEAGLETGGFDPGGA